MKKFPVDEPREIGKKRDRLSSKELSFVKDNLAEVVLRKKLKEFVRKEMSLIKEGVYAPGIFKAITSDPGFQSRMQQNKQNQQVTPGTTPPTTPPSASTPTLPPTTIPPVTQTPPVTPTPSATAVSGNTGGRVNMPTQPGDTGGPVNMPTQPGDTGGQVQY